VVGITCYAVHAPRLDTWSPLIAFLTVVSRLIASFRDAAAVITAAAVDATQLFHLWAHIQYVGLLRGTCSV